MMCGRSRSAGRIDCRLRRGKCGPRDRECLQGLELFQCRCHRPARSEQIREQAIIDVQIAFVFTKIAHLVAFRQHAPNLCAQPQRMRQHLKHDVTVGRTITMPPQGRQTQGMRRVVGQVKTPLQRQAGIGCILQARQPGFFQAGELGGIRRLRAQRFAGTAERLKRRARAPPRSPAAGVVTIHA